VNIKCSAPSKNVTCTQGAWVSCAENSYKLCQCTNWAAKRNTAKADVTCD
jgi:hypothetical protein